MRYCGEILGETDLTDFIDIVSCTGWSMALSEETFIDHKSPPANVNSRDKVLKSQPKKTEVR